MQDDTNEERKNLREHLAFMGRRFWPMLSAAAIVAIGAAAIAILLPPVYRSTATILIEEQEIPTDLVRTTISSYADQRIQVISQQVMTRSNLMQIVDKYGLYVQERKHETTEEILERMREDIKLDLVTADVIDRRSGNRTSAAIAFTLSFDSELPEKAQKVANELVSLYLNENLKNRKQQVDETSNFLSEEAARLSAHISEIESRLADFKKRNVGRLPELAQLNMQLRDRADSELTEVERQLQSIEERRFYLDAQLSQMKPNSPIISSTGERILDPAERLRGLQAQYAGMAGVYTEGHPDLLRMRGEMEALRKEAGQIDSAAEMSKQLDKQRTERAALRERYAADHPDVLRLDQAIASLERSLAQQPATSPAPPRKPENPTYLSFQSQFEALGTEHKAALAKRVELQRKRSLYEARIEQTPQVEREYLDLSRDHQNSVARYQEIKNKLMQAEVAQELEKDAKAERFSLIDPPQYPEKPRSPDRPAILLVGLVAAGGGGLGFAFVLEGLDGSVKNPRQLLRTLQAPLLSVIPYVVSDRERRRRRWRRVAIAMVVLICLAATLAAVHYFWMPLEVFWYYLLRRFMLN
jgi:polysaccharide biosynthesis transport protein